MINPDRVNYRKKNAVIGEKSTVNFATGLPTTLYRLSLLFSFVISYIIYLLCPLVWSIEIKRGRENEKVGGKQAKLNERESGRELEKGGETALTSNGRGSKKETEKGGAILLTSNGRKSRKGIEKGGAILLMSNGRENMKGIESRKEAQFYL